MATSTRWAAPVLLASLMASVPILLKVGRAEAAEAFVREPQEIDFLLAAPSVPREQVQYLRGDLRWLSRLETSRVEPLLLSTMEIPDAQSSTLRSWLQQRVRLVLGESFKPSLRTVRPMLLSSFEYPQPGELPDLELPSESEEEAADPETPADPDTQERLKKRKVQTVMSNVGAAIYLSGKSSNLPLLLRVPGVGRIPVTSPRVGVIQVGSGLFPELSSGSSSGSDDSSGFGLAPSSQARRASRLGTLFHEARHSDGNGKSLGFAHAICPVGHDYEGFNACDRNVNGPYLVGAMLTYHLRNNCSGCSSREQEVLALETLDGLSRIIPTKEGFTPTWWNSAPEGTVSDGLAKKRTRRWGRGQEK